MKTTLLLASAMALASAPAMAHDHNPRHPNKNAPEMSRADAAARAKAMIAEMDADKDGAVTRDEMTAHRTAQLNALQDKMFAGMDSDKDGQISRAEFDAHHQGMAMDMPPLPTNLPDLPPPAMGEKRERRVIVIRHNEGDGPEPMMKRPGHMLDQADTNKDGKLTESEAVTAALARFDRADANKDGKITANERPQRKMKIRKVIKQRSDD